MFLGVENMKLRISFLVLFLGFLVGCQKQGENLSASRDLAALSTSTTSSSSSSSVNMFQIITKANSTTGSFDNSAVPLAGGISVKAQRLFYLDGSSISTSNFPSWFSEAKLFLTSTRTSGTNPVTPTTSDTPCAYFDSYSDNNPDASGFYTIDGYNASVTTSDVDQCAGTAASELNQLYFYVKLDRRFMNSTDKIQFIFKAKIIDAPNTAPTTTSCVTGGNFDAAACSNQLFSLSLRTAPGASTKPFFYLFPSAKALELLSESLLLPIQNDTSITTISIDRIKGGAVFYGVSIIRLE